MGEEILTENEDLLPEDNKQITEEQTAESENEENGENTEDTVTDTTEEKDYESIIKEDIEFLRSAFPELSALSDITELDNPLRYAALRDLGLSAEEAYLATQRRKRADTRAHLFGAVPKAASSPTGTMSQRDLEGAREIFSGLSDSEIQRLYRKVSG